ncbi:MAG: hypothetical protein ABIJ09_17235 [Pseudomonadota bacterium]
MTVRARVLDVLLVALLVAYVMVAIAWLWTSPWLLTLLLIPPPLILATRAASTREAAILAFAGILLGPFTEACSVAGGLWTYQATGGLPLVPPWIFPLWGCFTPALWIVVRSISLRLPRPQVPAFHLVWLGLALAIEIIAYIELGHSTPLALAATVPLAALLLGFSRRLEVVIILLFGSVLGPLCESLPIAFGAWTYPNPELLGMPAWLPLGYGIFGVIVALSAEAALALLPAPQTLSATTSSQGSPA